MGFIFLFRKAAVNAYYLIFSLTVSNSSPNSSVIWYKAEFDDKFEDEEGKDEINRLKISPEENKPRNFVIIFVNMTRKLTNSLAY